MRGVDDVWCHASSSFLTFRLIPPHVPPSHGGSFMCSTNSLGGCRFHCTRRDMPTLKGTRADRIAGGARATGPNWYGRIHAAP